MICFPQQVGSLANYDMAVSHDEKSGNDVTGTMGIAMGRGVVGEGERGGEGERQVSSRWYARQVRSDEIPPHLPAPSRDFSSRSGYPLGRQNSADVHF